VFRRVGAIPKEVRFSKGRTHPAASSLVNLANQAVFPPSTCVAEGAPIRTPLGKCRVARMGLASVLVQKQAVDGEAGNVSNPLTSVTMCIVGEITHAPAPNIYLLNDRCQRYSESTPRMRCGSER